MTLCPITGKRQFASKAEAAAEIATCKAKAKSEPRRRESRCYRCPHCEVWHLTSRPKIKGRRS